MTNQPASLPIYHAVGQTEMQQFSTDQLRANFLIETLFEPGTLRAVYTHYDRVIVGGAMPAGQAVDQPTVDKLKIAYCLERPELGVINLCGP